MKFRTDYGRERDNSRKRYNAQTFEVSGIREVVENTVREKDVDGKIKKVKEGATYIWLLTSTKKGMRWLKYEWGGAAADAKILGGKSPIQMHMHIDHAIMARDTAVWFSGHVCNIETNLTIRDEQVAESRAGKKELLKELAVHLESQLCPGRSGS